MSTKKPNSDQDCTDKKSTNISLVNGKTKSRQYKKDKPSIFMQRGYQILLVLLLIGSFLSVIVYQTLFGHIQQPKQIMSIEQGQTYYGLLPKWQNGVPLFSATVAKLYIKHQVKSPLHAGNYAIPDNPTFSQLVQILQKGEQSALIKIQIIEGKTVKDLYKNLENTPGVQLDILENNKSNQQIVEKLDLDGILPDAVKNSSDPIVHYNLEGWFAPNTYYYNEGSSDAIILQDLYKHQQKALDNAWKNRAEDLPYTDPYQALIMASIIEKETSVPEERAMVSAVFVNRLKKNMRLQTDPTIIYGMGERYDGNIRKDNIQEKTSYNTYQINGLPPTPIALPSFASIEAALHPADSKALYFVATGRGGHTFSQTLEEHNKAVQEYLKVLRERKKSNGD